MTNNNALKWLSPLALVALTAVAAQTSQTDAPAKVETPPPITSETTEKPEQAADTEAPQVEIADAPPAKPKTPEKTPEKTKEAAKEAVEVNSGKSSEKFIPTESISEDLAVSFPVDI